MNVHRDRLNETIAAAAEKKKSNSFSLSRENYNQLLQNLETIAAQGCQTHQHYHHATKYEQKEFGHVKKNIRRGTEKFVVCNDDIFDIIHGSHIATGHGGRNIIEKE